MDPFTWLAVGTTLLGAYGDYKQYKSSKETAATIEQIARDNAALKRLEVQEQARRQELDDAREEATAKARASASGYSSSESATMYIKGLVAENDKQLSWLEMTGNMEADLIELQGQYESQSILAAGKANLWNIATRFAQAAFYAHEGGLFSSEADLLRDAEAFQTTPFIQQGRFTINNPVYTGPNFGYNL